MFFRSNRAQPLHITTSQGSDRGHHEHENEDSAGAPDLKGRRLAITAAPSERAPSRNGVEGPGTYLGFTFWIFL